MSFRRYETLILLSPNLGSEQLEAFKSKIEGVLAAGQGQIVRYEEWGRKRLAYQVRKENFGIYILYDFRATPALAAELERNCKIDEQVFKFLTLIKEKDFTEERLQAVLDQIASEASRKEKDKEAAAAQAAARAAAQERASGGQGADAPAGDSAGAPAPAPASEPGSDEAPEADSEGAPEGDSEGAPEGPSEAAPEAASDAPAPEPAPESSTPAGGDAGDAKE